jgi:hypothetical protein
MSEPTGPVSMAEACEVLDQLRELARRSRDNKQRLFHFTFSTCAESLDDNLWMAFEFPADYDE